MILLPARRVTPVIFAGMGGHAGSLYSWTPFKIVCDRAKIECIYRAYKGTPRVTITLDDESNFGNLMDRCGVQTRKIYATITKADGIPY